MPSISRSSKQAAKDRAALKRLQKSGTYSGKIDLRKAPTRYQLQKIKQLAEKRKASKQPLPPAQKTPGATVKRTRMTEKQVRDLKPGKGGHELNTYALPFLRKGQVEPEWRRFTYQQLNKFLNEYKADDPEGAAEWKSYAVKETWIFDTDKQVREMRKETNYYFSGVRIDEPKGTIRKVRKNQFGNGRRKRAAK